MNKLTTSLMKKPKHLQPQALRPGEMPKGELTPNLLLMMALNQLRAWPKSLKFLKWNYLALSAKKSLPGMIHYKGIWKPFMNKLSRILIGIFPGLSIKRSIGKVDCGINGDTIGARIHSGEAVKCYFVNCGTLRYIWRAQLSQRRIASKIHPNFPRTLDLSNQYFKSFKILGWLQFGFVGIGFDGFFGLVWFGQFGLNHLIGLFEFDLVGYGLIVFGLLDQVRSG